MKKYTIKINSQTDRFENLDKARAYVEGLIKAGVWFIELDSEEIKT